MNSSNSEEPQTPSEETPPPLVQSSTREYFIFTDATGTMWCFGVEGKNFKDLQRVTRDTRLRTCTALAWKTDLLALGNMDEGLCFWTSASAGFLPPVSAGIQSLILAPLKRIRFAPGKGNLKLLVLHSSGIMVLDARDRTLIASRLSPREILPLWDADWATSDRLVVITHDGCLRILDAELRSSSSPIEMYEPFSRQNVGCCWAPAAALPPRLLPIAEVLLTLPSGNPRQEALQDCNLTGRRLTALNTQLHAAENSVPNPDPKSFAGRCMTAAYLLGDSYGTTFWSVVEQQLRPSLSAVLPPRFHTLDIPRHFKTRAVERLYLLLTRINNTPLPTATALRKKVAFLALTLGQWESASQCLLHTAPVEDGSDANGLDPDHYQSMLKVRLEVAFLDFDQLKHSGETLGNILENTCQLLL